MPHTREALVTAPIAEHHDLLETCPTPLAIPRQRPAALLHFLWNLVPSWMRRRTSESRWIRPDLPRYETPIDYLARRHTYLYIRSMSG